YSSYTQIHKTKNTAQQFLNLERKLKSNNKKKPNPPEKKNTKDTISHNLIKPSNKHTNLRLPTNKTPPRTHKT
ncbi:hypothetical protein, partial [Klebsiella pneumoniae]|uniref:hypothetical protein n=1 Tax=Klebsiella pneumoniae TaxID=573 RepID=UPI00273052B5